MAQKESRNGRLIMPEPSVQPSIDDIIKGSLETEATKIEERKQLARLHKRVHIKDTSLACKRMTRNYFLKRKFVPVQDDGPLGMWVKRGEHREFIIAIPKETREVGLPEIVDRAFLVMIRNISNNKIEVQFELKGIAFVLQALEQLIISFDHWLTVKKEETKEGEK